MKTAKATGMYNARGFCCFLIVLTIHKNVSHTDLHISRKWSPRTFLPLQTTDPRKKDLLNETRKFCFEYDFLQILKFEHCINKLVSYVGPYCTHEPNML